jgi:aldehyde dehydrogenase (NAD(P)+)
LSDVQKEAVPVDVDKQVELRVDNPAALDTAVADLAAHKQEWAQLSAAEKRAFIEPMRTGTRRVAEAWAMAGAHAKRLPSDSPLIGEEWMSGPWGLLYGLNALNDSLEALERGKSPRLRKVRERDNGQVVVEVYPAHLFDSLLLSGISAEVWMQPGVTRETLTDTMALHYKSESPEGAVALVLGAGNISSIAPLDVLYKLLVEGHVVVLKTHPVMDYLTPFLEEVFGELIDRGFVRIFSGGIEVGSYFAEHPEVDEIHLTGSWKTHDAIVFGAGEEGKARKRRGERLNHRRVTAELGCVTPTIVLPGPWSEADIRYQAEHIATQKSYNAGFNCVAAQALILPKEWSQASQLVEAVQEIYQAIEPRYAYYPGAEDRRRAAELGHDQVDRLGDSSEERILIADLDPQQVNDTCFQTEIFAEALATISLPGETPEAFLSEAVRFSNEVLWGTLGANIIAHPKTIKALGPALEQAIADLRYGSVGINLWVGGAYLLSQATWGAYPGHTHEDIQSGVGVVHNSLMFSQPEKSVLRGPFYPFPRNLLHGEFHNSPKPPWFVTHKRAAELGRKLVDYEANRGLRHLPGLFIAALRG